MFKQNFITAWRNLVKHKANTVINVVGLAVGLCCCVLMLQFVRDEWMYDKFHTKSDRIYRAFTYEKFNGEEYLNTVTPFPLGPTIDQHIPEVELTAKFFSSSRLVRATPSGTALNETITFVSPSFFDIFDFPPVAGAATDLLPARNCVVLTAQLAEKYFPGENPVGRPLQIRVDSLFVNHIVTGVLADPPANSSLQFGILLSMDYESSLAPPQVLASWSNVLPETYVLLREGARPADLEPKIRAMLGTVLGEKYNGGSYAAGPLHNRVGEHDANYWVGFQPLTDIHLNSEMPAGQVAVSDRKYSYILGGVAVLVLLIACINFMTLSIGQSVTRAREVAVRKATGAQRSQLVVQFLGETFVLALFAVLVGLVLARAALPLFNSVTGKALVLQIDPWAALTLGGLLVGVCVLAGSYPALVLSGLRPESILKGQFKLGHSGRSVRRGLVVAQFVFSIVLISSALIMQRQLEFLQNKRLGYNQNHLVTVPFDVAAKPGVVRRIAAGFDYGADLKQRLASLTGIQAASITTHGFENGWLRIGYPETGADRQRYFHLNVVDPDYIATAGMRIVQGRDFQRGNTADASRAIVVNQALAKAYGWTDAVGRRLPGAKFADHEIIGVVEDFNYASLHHTVEPLVLSVNPMLMFSGANDVSFEAEPLPRLLLRLNPADAPGAIEQLRAAWKTAAPGQPFDFTFVDAGLGRQYERESNLRKITLTASMLAIAVALFGLFGLATLSINSRIKEIGIRKVLGATVGGIYTLVSREFLRLVAFALVLSIPVAWYFMARWLDDFAYRIEINWQVFAVAGLLTAALTLLAVSFQAARAALVNPVQSLRNE